MENVQFFANNGSVNISTANSSLSGSGTLGLVLTAGNATGAAGTCVESITIKSTGDTTLGMVRLFINDGSNSFLFKEIMVPANDQTNVVKAFSYTISWPFMIQPGYRLYASTQNNESFNISTIANDIINCSC